MRPLVAVRARHAGRPGRPFGYYGFPLGGLAALCVMGLAGVAGTSSLAAALRLGPLAQAIGRLRCLVQGCCHGKLASHAYGLRVTHPRSRISALGNLAGVPIHPTQLYSIIGNLALMLVLLRLWNMEAPWPVVSGLNLILSSTVRFIEEHYRGEPQTARWAGLAIYQWLAAGFFLAGLALLTIDAAATAAAHWLSRLALG